MSNTTAKRVVFDRPQKGDFYSVLREKVDNYFRENKLSPYGNWLMLTKIIVILSLFAGTYGLLVSGLVSSAWGMLGLAVAHGFSAALIGLNITHDAVHGSLSSNRGVNRWLGSLFNLIGGNDYIWRLKHNVVHHTYTNVPGHDDDVDQGVMFRFDPQQKYRWFYKMQHIYSWLLYPLATLSWVFAKDYINFFKSHIASYEVKNRPRKEGIRLFVGKITYYTIFIVIPFIVIPMAWWQIALGILSAHFVAGMTLSVIFQLAHLVEGTDFPVPDEKGKVNQSWAELQMYTTADFSPKNPVVNFLFGGLNYQIEHHLFPQVCHVHYTKLAPLVKETAERFNLPYIVNHSMPTAIMSHIRLLKTLGSAEDVQVTPAASLKKAS